MAVNLNSFEGRYTVKVRLTREFNVRLWIGLRLIWLASRIMRCHYKEEVI